MIIKTNINVGTESSLETHLGMKPQALGQNT